MSQTVPLTLDTVIMRNPALAAQLIDEDVALLHLTKGEYYTLNPTGAFVWECLREPQHVSQLRDALLAEYETTPEECERDLFILLADLMDEDLVQVATPPPA